MSGSSISNSENPLEEVVADDAREARRGRYGWLSLVIAALFGLFYAYDVWEAIGRLLGVPGLYSAPGFDARIPWWLLWAAVAIPPLVFAVAVVLSRRRNVFGKALIFLVGLAVVAGLTLACLALEYAMNPVVYLGVLPLGS